jgi:hypothetical protein
LRGDLRRLLELEQRLRDQIVNDLLQELKSVPGEKTNRNFTRAAESEPLIF